MTETCVHQLLQRPLVVALLLAVHEEARPREGRAVGAGTTAPEVREAFVSLPRLSKRLGVGASVVLRELTLLGDAILGGKPGPGWVRVLQADGRWQVVLTPAGRQCVGLLLSAD